MGENFASSTPTINQIKQEPKLFISQLTCKSSVTLEELLNARNSIQNCSDETNTQLKRNVYKNYQLFIDTSKEISHLKNEMSHLSTYLNDEYKCLESLLMVSIAGSRTGLTMNEKKEALEKVKEERERKMLKASQISYNGPVPTKEFRSIIDHIEGGAGMLENRQNCLVYCDGEVTELDENYKEIDQLYLILLNDSLIITTIMKDALIKMSLGQSPTKMYKFQSIIDLESIAVVNVKDRRCNKFEMAFKILMATTDKVFLTESLPRKKIWIDAFEAAKKFLRTNRMQHRDQLYLPASDPSLSGASGSANFDRISSGSSLVSNSSVSDSSGKPSLQYSSPSLNPFEEPSSEPNNQTDNELPYWLVELPDDLDVYIAQRNFDEAVKLVTQAHEHFYLYPKWCENQMQVDLKLKIDNKISELVEALTSELNVAPDRSLQTGPRASRRAVSLLVRLGKSSLAIRLFLDQRKRLLKYYFKQQKVTDGATITFMKRVTNLFFSHFVETSKEFLRAFEIDKTESGSLLNENLASPDSNNSLTWLEAGFMSNGGKEPNGTGDTAAGGAKGSSIGNLYSHTALACLNAWIYEQFNRYLDLFPRHVFINQVNTLTAVECISLAIHQCMKLRQTIGLDLLFVLSKRLKENIQTLILEINDKFMEAIKLRAHEDSMQPQIFDSRAKLNKFLTEMSEYDLDVSEFVIENGEANEDNQNFSVSLSLNTCTFAKSYLNMLKDLLKLANNFHSIQTINRILLHSFQWQMNHLKSCLKNGRNTEFVRRNIVFMLDRFVPVVIQKYCTILNVRSFNHLQTVSLQYANLKEENGGSGNNHSPGLSPVPTPRARKTRLVNINCSGPSYDSPESPVSPTKTSFSTCL